jgi:hypothetical protein
MIKFEKIQLNSTDFVRDGNFAENPTEESCIGKSQTLEIWEKKPHRGLCWSIPVVTGSLTTEDKESAVTWACLATAP